MGPRLGHLDLSITIGFVSPALADKTVRVTADKLRFERSQVAARVGDTIE